MKTFKRGISLIILVVIILVLAILATTVITIVFNNDIINKSKNNINIFDENTINHIISFYKSEYMLLKDKDTYLNEAEYISKKLEESNNLWLAEQITIRSKIKAGDYIKYSPVTGKYSVVGGEQGTGYEDIQTFTTDSDLKWRVYRINDDYSVDIIPTWLPNNVIYLDGAAGANNGIEILNDLCENLYSNQSIGAVARSINMEDINEKTEYRYMEYRTTPISVASKPNYTYPVVWKYDYGNFNSSIEHSLPSIDENGIYSYSIEESAIINKSDLDQSLLYYWSKRLDKSEDFYISVYLKTNLGNNNLPAYTLRYWPKEYTISINGEERYFAIMDSGITIHDIKSNPELCIDIDYSDLPGESQINILKEKCIEVVNTKKTVADEELAGLVNKYSFSRFLPSISAWVATKMYGIDETGYDGSKYLENIHLYTLRGDEKIQGAYMYEANGSTHFLSTGEYFGLSVIPVVNIPIHTKLKNTGYGDYVRKGYIVYDIIN